MSQFAHMTGPRIMWLGTLPKHIFLTFGKVPGLISPEKNFPNAIEACHHAENVMLLVI